MRWYFLPFSVILICGAHFIRVLRWELFVSAYEKPDRRRLIQSLSVGFLLNFFLPMKLGEFVRAILSGKSMKNGMPLSFATVAVDRYLDIIVVGLIFAVLAAIQPSGSNISSTAFFYIVLAAGFAALTGICVVLKRYLKKGIQIVARLFNHRIELAILQFFWALIWCFKNIAQL